MNKTLNLSYTELYEMSDLDDRRLYLNTDVDECLFDTIVYHILRYNREDRENNIPVEERKPILLFINSPGGVVTDGYGLIDAILASKTPVYTINQGMCASMAFLIFLSGDRRFCMEHSQFLMHDGTSFCIDSTAKAKDRLEFETNKVEKVTKEYIISRTKITDAVYDERYRMEWYFLPDEAKKYGVVTDIVGVDCSIDEIL